MRAIAFILLYFFFLQQAAYSQLTIKISNPEPRVGETVTLSFPAQIFDEYLSRKLPKELGPSSKRPEFIEKKIIPNREGKVVLGPFKIRVNGKRYKTNAVTVNVLPALTPREGLWIRVVQQDGESLILLEQVIRREAISTFSTSGVGTSWNSEASDFAGLIEDSEFEGLTFDARNSGWGHSPNTLIDWPNEFAYCYKFYRVKKSANFTQPVKLSIKHFSNLDKGTEIPDVVIH